MPADLQTIREDFALLDNWEDKYRYVIELGDDLASYPESARDDAHRVHGCASRVWLNTQTGGGADPIMHFEGDSDAHIVRGLVAIVLALFSNRKASEISETDAEPVLRSLGLDEHLTRQRANGLRSMIKRIKEEAAATSIQS